jgi:hypothetical protein
MGPPRTCRSLPRRWSRVRGAASNSSTYEFLTECEILRGMLYSFRIWHGELRRREVYPQ